MQLKFLQRRYGTNVACFLQSSRIRQLSIISRSIVMPGSCMMIVHRSRRMSECPAAKSRKMLPFRQNPTTWGCLAKKLYQLCHAWRGYALKWLSLREILGAKFLDHAQISVDRRYG